MTPAHLRAARRRLGLTQQQLADALDVHRVTVAEWERERTDGPPIPRIVALAIEALRVRERRRLRARQRRLALRGLGARLPAPAT